MIDKGKATVRSILNNPSWFREHPHYWALASLPFAYAMACVEVVSRNSGKAEAIYRQIIQAWGKPGVKAMYEAILSEIPDSVKEELKQALIQTKENIEKLV
jgi:hypothetical protein